MANIFSLDELRTSLVDKGYVEEGAPDEELIVKYSEAAGRDPFEIAEYFGVKTGAGKSVSAGLSSGIDMVQGLGLNAAAAGAAALGLRDTEERLALAAERQGYEGYLAGNPELERIEDQSLSTALPYLGYQVGRQGPLLAGLTATTLVNPAAGVAAGASIGVGSLYESAREADGFVSSADLVQIGAKSIPYTAFESLTPMVFSQMIRSGRGGVAGAAAGGVRGFGAEATTELGQTELEISMNPNLTEEQKDSMRLNAAIAGGVTGGALGTVGGYFGREAPDDSDGIDLTSDRSDSTPVDTNNMEQAELDLEPTFQYEDGRDEIGAPDPFMGGTRTSPETAEATTEFDNENQAVLELEDVPEFDSDGNYLYNVIPNNQEARLRAVGNTRDRIAQLQADQKTTNRTKNRVANVAYKNIQQINQEIAQVDARIAEIEADPNLVSNNPIKPEYRKEYKALNNQKRALQEKIDQQSERAAPIAARFELQALMNALVSLQDGVDVADMPADQQAALNNAIPEEVKYIQQRNKMQQEMDLTTPDIEAADNQIDEVQEEAVADTPVEESIEVSEEVDTVEDVDTTPTTVDAPMPVAAEGVSQETLEEDFAAESAINETNAENDRLQAEVGTEGRAPTGRVSLDKNIFAGVMRMVKSKSPNPKPVIYKMTKDGKQTTEPDQAATAKNAEKMQRIYNALMKVAATKKKMDDKGKNIFYGREDENEGKRKISTADKNARQARDYQQTLRTQIEELIDAAEGEGNVQALVSMIKKYRDQFSTATSLSEKAAAQYSVQFNKSRAPFESMLDVLNTVDTELSSAFASYRDGDLTADLDRVSARPIRDGKKSKDAKTKLERIAERDGVVGILEELTKRTGTRSPYVIMLGSAIRYGIENMQKAGFGPTLEFISEGNPYYDRGLNTIFIRKEASEEEILHETLHAATAWYVQANPSAEVVQELRDTLDVVLNTATPQYVQALDLSPASKERINSVMQILRDLKNSGSPDDAVLELVSYGTTLRDFKDMLKEISMAESPSLKNWSSIIEQVWNKLVGLVSQILGVKGTVANNVLSNTYRLLELSIDDAPVKANFVSGHLNSLVSQGNPHSDMAGNSVEMNEEQQGKRKAYVGRNVTRMLMENLGVPQGIDFVSKGVDSVNDYIKENLPLLENGISRFNSRYGVTPAISALMNMWKQVRNTPLLIVNDLIMRGFENQSVDRRRAILEYLDDTNLDLIEQYKDSENLKLLANSLLEHYNKFVALLPQQERQLFEGKKFTEALLYVSSGQDVSSHSLGQRSITDLAKSALLRIDEADIDTNLDLFNLDQEGYPILNEPMFMITVTDSLSGNEYKLMASKERVEALGKDNLPIGDGYVVHDSTPLQFVQLTGGNYTFREVNDYRQNLDDRATDRITIGMLNTMAALSNYSASKDFIQGIINYDGEPVVYDNAELARAGTGNENLQITEAGDMKSPEIFSRTRSSQHWIRVSNNEGIWGPLAGKVIHAPVWHAMNDMSSRKPLFSVRVVNDTVTYFKETKTIQNPGTHITNVASNVALLIMHGIPLRTLVKAAKLLWEYEVHPERFKNPNRAADLQIMKDFYNSGALQGTFSAVEIRNALQKAHFDSLQENEIGTVDSVVKHFMQSEILKNKYVSRLGSKFQQFRNGAQQLYAAEDNAFRLAAYINKIEELGGDNTPENQYAAGQAALKMFLDYDIDAPAAKALRQSIMPFVSWTYAAIPLITKIAAQKPWQIANLFIAYTMIDLVAAGLAGDDEEARKRGPERLDDRFLGLRTHIRIPFMGDANNPVYYKLGDYIPLASTFQASPTPVFGFENYPQGFKPSGPLVDSLLMILSGNNTFTGKSLYDTTDSDLTKTLRVGEALVDLVGVPPWLQRYSREDYFEAMDGTRDMTGQAATTVASAIASRFLGLKVVDFNAAEEAVYRQLEEKQVTRDYKAAIRKLQREEMRSGSPDYQALYADIQRLELELAEEVKKIYKIEDE